MIVGAAFLPHPPVLVPEVAQTAAPELDALRAACRIAIERVAAPGRALCVLGSAPRTRPHAATARGTLAGFGVPLEIPLGSDDPGPVELPLSLTIGAWLLRDCLGAGNGATGWSVGPDLPELGVDEPTALLVMGDGSARRSTAAPGYLDPRAESFDRRVAAALGAGAPIPVDGAEELLVAGVDAWRAASAVLGGTAWDAELHYDDAPYGVGYFVASWTR